MDGTGRGGGCGVGDLSRDVPNGLLAFALFAARGVGCFG